MLDLRDVIGNECFVVESMLRIYDLILMSKKVTAGKLKFKVLFYLGFVKEFGFRSIEKEISTYFKI